MVRSKIERSRGISRDLWLLWDNTRVRNEASYEREGTCKSIQLCNYLHTSFSFLQRFESHFSDALRKEYSSKGITVQVQVCVHTVKILNTSIFLYTVICSLPSYLPSLLPPPLLSLLSSHLVSFHLLSSHLLSSHLLSSHLLSSHLLPSHLCPIFPGC